MNADVEAMMRRSCGLVLAGALALGAIPVAQGADAAEPVGPRLPERVRGLLLQEMNAVLGATHQILDALVRGQDQLVARKAQAIHDSFILKQQMSEADRQALRATVPTDFVERDRAFHELSAALARAARDGDAARQRELFGQMIDACAGCHERYAHDRFAGFRRH